MPLYALLLILLAALFHAGWNLLLKQAGERYIIMWWIVLFGALVLLPTLWWQPLAWQQVWPFIISSAVAEALYFSLLVAAYRLGDFSLVYPIARGSAPLLLALWSTLFLGEQISGWGGAGLAIVTLGLMIVGSSAWWHRSAGGGASPQTIGLALSVAVLISLYSAIDAAAVQYTSPVPYVGVVFALTALFVFPIVYSRFGLKRIWIEGYTHWRRILWISLMNVAGYSIVVAVYSLGHVSYGGAIREISVVFGALAGWRWLGEGFGVMRVIGAAVIFTGIVVIAVVG